MNDYVILTDSSCDLPDDIVKKYQLEILQLDFIVEGEGSFHNDQADIEKVYSKLRNGANIKTSAANISQASEAIEALFNQKKDILYLGFSSGLSSTYQTVYMAGQELMEEYPERKMVSVDTLAASMGQGLLVYKAYRRYKIKTVSLVYSRRSVFLKKRRTSIRCDSDSWHNAVDQADPACG